ncbi:MAG: efflux RND transporter periplasmic adaptor subunit [Motiliproteus sp.]|nr:efflux RND transporter periplasmic adaptor subunit [Motiliproteus sp.]MCW9054160.1 efflux RND transporter periplasmic adaptor subunit [Motiliproteus sp.]
MPDVKIGSIAIALCMTLGPSTPLWAQSDAQSDHGHDHQDEQPQLGPKNLVEGTKKILPHDEGEEHGHGEESNSTENSSHEENHNHDEGDKEALAHDEDEGHDHESEPDDHGKNEHGKITAHEEDEDHDHDSEPDDHDKSDHEESHDHEESGESGHEEESSELSLTPKQQEMIDLEVVQLELRSVAAYTQVPGEVLSNAYNTSVISPLTDVRILKRHAVLGQHIRKGQPMVTLFSDQLAGLMGDLSISAREWSLVRKLGVQLAGKQRYDQARSNYRQHVSKVKAFGINDDQIVEILDSQSKQLLGQFTLYAPHDGVVQKDEFLIGQHFQAGAELFVLVNESSVWVQAQVPPNQHLDIDTGSTVSISIAGVQYSGSLTQLAHSIDEVTRTRMARITLDNSSHQLHPGQFAQVQLPTDEAAPALTLPESSFTRTPDGDWGVFVESDPGRYQLKEVEIISEFAGFRVIEGLPIGTTVVTKGAFFLASEQAKSGFDIHNH